jgi:SAM-dependent methyltransferase
MEPSPQQYISGECETDYLCHGDNWQGVGYTHSEEEAHSRYALMLEVIRERTEPVSILDFGCGLAHMLDYLESRTEHGNVRYTGLDLSAKYLEAARRRHPDADLVRMDVLASDAELAEYDYVILNGLFNFRGEISEAEMFDYWKRLLIVSWRHARRGLAFNVMSKIVDWERDDLFHLPFDAMSAFVAAELGRHFVIRHDYAAYEYTVYVYREPSGP